MSATRAILFAALVGIVLIAVAAWLLNVPLVAVAVGAAISLLVVLLWLSRHAAVGKRSGAGAQDEKSGRM